MIYSFNYLFEVTDGLLLRSPEKTGWICLLSITFVYDLSPSGLFVNQVAWSPGSQLWTDSPSLNKYFLACKPGQQPEFLEPNF